MYDEMKPGDMKKGATDHGCDAWRYLLMAREPLSDVPAESAAGQDSRAADRGAHQKGPRHGASSAQSNARDRRLDGEAITRELGIRDDDEEAEASVDGAGDVWQ
jgi:hypothetical protein